LLQAGDDARDPLRADFRRIGSAVLILGDEVRLEVAGAGSPGPGRPLVLAVGVSTYANHPGLQLRYAAKDAEDLVLRLEKEKGGRDATSAGGGR
jgi:hypothetical protein